MQAVGRGTKAAQAVVQPRRRAVQAARAAVRTAAVPAKAVGKAAAPAAKAAAAAVHGFAAAIAGGGGAVIAVVLVLCLAGALLLSPLGIFLSGEDSGGQTISAVIREINSEYDAKLEELKEGVTYDELNFSGLRAPWVC